MFTRFVANSEKCRKYAFLGGPPRLLRYYKGGVIEIYYNTTRGGGFPDLLQYYKGEGGVSPDPRFVLRNIWTAPYQGLPGIRKRRKDKDYEYSFDKFGEKKWNFQRNQGTGFCVKLLQFPRFNRISFQQRAFQRTCQHCSNLRSMNLSFSFIW